MDEIKTEEKHEEKTKEKKSLGMMITAVVSILIIIAFFIWFFIEVYNERAEVEQCKNDNICLQNECYDLHNLSTGVDNQVKCLKLQQNVIAYHLYQLENK